MDLFSDDEEKEDNFTFTKGGRVDSDESQEEELPYEQLSLSVKNQLSILISSELHSCRDS